MADVRLVAGVLGASLVPYLTIITEQEPPILTGRFLAAFYDDGDRVTMVFGNSDHAASWREVSALAEGATPHERVEFIVGPAMYVHVHDTKEDDRAVSEIRADMEQLEQRLRAED